MDQNPLIRPLVSVFELAAFVMLLWATPKVRGLGKWVAFAICLVALRFFYGWGIANIQYQTDVLGSLQEGRFGFLIISAPVAYYFFKNATVQTLDKLIRFFVIFALLIDIYVFVTYINSGVLRLADRSSDRFVLSLISPMMAIWLKGLIVQRQGSQPGVKDYLVLAFFLLHIALLTTSRSETVLLGSIIAQWAYARAPNLRWPLVAAVLVVAYFAVDSILQQGQQVAGRDYAAALYYAQEAFPFGIGFVPEAAQKAQLGRASNFFISDYGPLVLIYRYGLLGVLMAAGLIAFWARFALRAVSIPGAALVAVATLFYICIVPILDYGSLNGGMLLGMMAAVASIGTAYSLSGPRRARMNAGMLRAA